MTHRSPSARDEWLLLLAALMALGGWIAYLAHGGQREHELRAREQLFAQAEVVHDNLTRQLDAIQRAQRNIRAEWGDGAQGERLPALIGRRLQAFAEIMPAVRAMAVLDAQGRVLASSRSEQIGTDESARDHFRVPAKGGVT